MTNLPEDAGSYYDRKARDAETLVQKLAEAVTAGASAEEIRRLELALERARYVGD